MTVAQRGGRRVASTWRRRGGGREAGADRALSPPLSPSDLEGACGWTRGPGEGRGCH